MPSHWWVVTALLAAASTMSGFLGFDLDHGDVLDEDERDLEGRFVRERRRADASQTDGKQGLLDFHDRYFHVSEREGQSLRASAFS